jgi:hypothetical protein
MSTFSCRCVDVDQFTVTIEGVNASDVRVISSVSLGCSDTPYDAAVTSRNHASSHRRRSCQAQACAQTSRGRLTDTGNPDGTPSAVATPPAFRAIASRNASCPRIRDGRAEGNDD